ncbi:cobalamin adenosyltransferase [Tepidibacter sp. Z1-5]|uniref:cobalamin adenosyltransferase n=1 Tax=Tepidibacter sp. Z1-5 TaxID=3134138 RepID=UPI0030C3EF4F
MSILTESEIKNRIKNKELKPFDEFKVKKGVIITPLAISFLKENKIKLKYVDDEKCIDKENEDINVSRYKYITEYGGFLDKKPEYMTQLYKNKLVFKDNKLIKLRGKLDSLQSEILKAQIYADKMKLDKLVKDLQEILDFVRNILKCEIIDEAIEEFNLLNMNETELRDISHHPKKYFGIDHLFTIDYKLGEVVVILNSLRSLVRETELVAYSAFKNEEGKVVREDIIKALNRLSSLMYIMIFKYLKGNYD